MSDSSDYNTVEQEAQDVCEATSRMVLAKYFVGSSAICGALYWYGNRNIPFIQNMQPRLKRPVVAMIILGISVLRSEQAMTECVRETQQVRYHSKFA